MTDVKKMKQKSEAIKLNEVKNGKSTVDEKKVKKLIEMKAYKETLSKTAREVSQEVVNKTVRKAVRSAELQKKFPSVPGAMHKLSEPSHGTYVALYNKYCDVLKPKMVSNVKEKIAGYLETIEERTNKEKLVKQKQMLKRKARKLKAIEEEKNNLYINSCAEQCDELFEIMLAKFTDAYNGGMPQPLVMGPKSRELQQEIKLQMIEMLNPVTDEKAITVELIAKDVSNVMTATDTTTTTASSTKVDATTKDGTSTQNDQTEKADTSTPVDSKSKADSTTGSHSTTESNLTARDGSTTVVDSTTGFDKKKEFDRTVDILSYFIMEFVKKSLVEAVKVDRI